MGKRHISRSLRQKKSDMFFHVMSHLLVQQSKSTQLGRVIETSSMSVSKGEKSQLIYTLKQLKQLLSCNRKTGFNYSAQTVTSHHNVCGAQQDIQPNKYIIMGQSLIFFASNILLVCF